MPLSGQKAGEVQKTPMDNLKVRYAKGEITSEQFPKISEDREK